MEPRARCAMSVVLRQMARGMRIAVLKQEAALGQAVLNGATPYAARYFVKSGVIVYVEADD